MLSAPAKKHKRIADAADLTRRSDATITHHFGVEQPAKLVTTYPRYRAPYFL